MTILCAERVSGLPPTAKDYMAPRRGCLLPTRDPSSDRAEAVPGTSLVITMSTGGGGGGDAHESEQFLI